MIGPKFCSGKPGKAPTSWDNVMFGGDVSKTEAKSLDRTKDRPEDEVVVIFSLILIFNFKSPLTLGNAEFKNIINSRRERCKRTF